MRIFAAGALSFAGAIFAAVYYLPLRWMLIPSAILAVLGCICMAVSFKWRVLCTVMLLSAALGLGWTWSYYQLFLSGADLLDGQTIRISATVTDFSSEAEYGYRIPVKLSMDGRYYSAYLYYEDPELYLQPGDAVSLMARLKRPVSAVTDDPMIYTSQGIMLRAFAVSEVNIYRPEETPWRYLPLFAAKRLCQAMEQVFRENMTPFIKALVLGDRSEMDETFVLDISRTGMQHIFVVSGMHVGFLISILALLLPQRHLLAIIGSLMVTFFAVMVGITPSVIRAAVMYIFTLVTKLIKRDKDDITTLSFILTLLLMHNPYAIADPALQLSFACAAGMSVFSHGIYQRFKDSFPKFTGNPVGRFITASISSSMGVMILSVPALCVIFRKINILAPLSNLLTLWAFEICFIVGIVASLVGMANLALGRLLAFAAYPAFLYIRQTLKLLADVPFASMSTDNVMMVVWLSCTYAMGVLSVLFKNRRPWVQSCCSMMLLGSFLLASWRYESTTPLTFTALDVGQGQCLVLTSMGHTVVIDCGGTTEPALGLLTYLGDIQQTHIDALILTHYHDDHAEYAPQILETIPTDMVILPAMEDDTGNKFSTIYSALRSGADVQFIEADSTLTFGCCSIRIFAPMTIGQQNERCLSMVITCGDNDILVTGDMGTQQEGWLADTRELPDCEVLVCGHHGSKYATSDYFLETATPETAVISVGVNNYGHPADDTLQRLADHNVKVRRTDQEGSITIRYQEVENNG